MGAEVCRSVADDVDLTLVAAIDPFHAGIDLRQATGVDVLPGRRTTYGAPNSGA